MTLWRIEPLNRSSISKPDLDLLAQQDQNITRAPTIAFLGGNTKKYDC